MVLCVCVCVCVCVLCVCVCVSVCGGEVVVYWEEFWLVRGTSLHHPSRENPV